MLQRHKNLLSPAEDPKLSSGFPKRENIIPNTSFSGNRYRKAMPGTGKQCHVMLSVQTPALPLSRPSWKNKLTSL